MTKDEIISMAREAGFCHDINNGIYLCAPMHIERFAALVAKHTLANIDPSSFMSWQEGYEAGRLDEREECAELVWPTHQVKVWSDEELAAMTGAFNKAQEKHGWYETIMAVGAAALKGRAAAIRARGQE